MDIFNVGSDDVDTDIDARTPIHEPQCPWARASLQLNGVHARALHMIVEQIKLYNSVFSHRSKISKVGHFVAVS
jgi:hypothetical protein